MKYRVNYGVEHPAGIFYFYGRTYPYLWMAKLAEWFAGFFPDFRWFQYTEIQSVEEKK